MTTICPNTGDMEKCDKKSKCKWGNCEGQSLPSKKEDYCPDTHTFRPDYCDCEAVYGFVARWGWNSKNGYFPSSRNASQIVTYNAPYYDAQGRLIVDRLLISESCASWGPAGSGPFLVTPCGDQFDYTGFVSIEKRVNCQGSGPGTGSAYLRTYRDGVQLGRSVSLGATAGLPCNNTIGDYNDGYVGFFTGETRQIVQDQIDDWLGGSGPPA